jgi:hypothetical protein
MRDDGGQTECIFDVLFQFSANGLLSAVLQHLGDHCRDFAISLESRLSLEIRVEFCVVSRELLG